MMVWQTSPLGQLVRFRNGKSIRPGGEGQYAVFGSNGLIGRSEEFLYRDAIILGRVGAYCGSVAYCPDAFWASDNTIVVEPNEDVFDTRFAFYALTGANLSRWAGGAAQPLITQTALRGVKILIPSLDVQRRIAGILSTYDDLIDVNTRRMAILEEMTGRLFDEWFVRFRFPGHQIEKFVKANGGIVPASWQGHTLDNLIELRYGKALKADKRVVGPFPVYGSSGIVGWHNEALVEGPGIIVGRKGNVGAVHWCHHSFYPIDTVFYVSTSWPLSFVYHVLRGQKFLNSDSAVPGLNRNQALRTVVGLPSRTLAAEFDRHAGNSMQLLAKLAEVNIALHNARDLLLPKLLSGEIDLGHTDRRVENLTKRPAAE